MSINIIAAIGENRELGKDGHLLWHISEDLRRFKNLTQGQIILMGRKTFASIGKKLPGRVNIIISRQKNFQANGCLVFNSLEKGLTKAKEISRQKGKKVFIIGGASIYQQTISQADSLYLTIIKGKFMADVFFPNYTAFSRIISKKKSHSNNYSYQFLVLEREESERG